MAEEKPTLKESIEKAANEQEAKVEDTKTEEEKVEESVESETFKSDPEIEEAINFYKALKDPSQQVEIIAELARRAGLLNKTEQPTKSEVKKYTQLMEEVLGQEYPDLKDKMAKVFDAFEKENDTKLLYLKHQMDVEKQEAMAQAFETEFASFIKENKVTEAVASRMIKEIEELPPSKGKDGRMIPLSNYLSKIHRIANSDVKKVVDTEKRIEKVNSNLAQRATNLQSDVSESRLKQGSKLPTIREAVQAAYQGIKFDQD